MSNTSVTVTFTLAEARELLAVAGNGWGDGDYYGLNDRIQTRGGEKAAKIFCAAREKLQLASLFCKIIPLATATPLSRE